MPDKVGELRVSWQQWLAARVTGKAVDRPRYNFPTSAGPALDDADPATFLER